MDRKELADRYNVRPLSPLDSAAVIAIQARCKALAVFINANLADCRELDAALGRIEEACHWALAAVERGMLDTARVKPGPKPKAHANSTHP